MVKRFIGGTPSTALIFLVAFLAGCFSGESPPENGLTPSTDIEDSRLIAGATVQNATWSVQWDGDLAVSMILRSELGTECRWIWASWGISEHLQPTTGHLVEGSAGGPYFNAERGQGNFDASVTVHAAGAVDEEAIPARYGWADYSNRTYEIQPGQDMHLTWFGIGLQPDDRDGLRPRYSYIPESDGNTSVFMQVECSTPVEISGLAMSTDVIVFSEATLRGGAGIHAHVAFDPNGIVLASGVSTTIEATRGILAVSLRGDLLLNHVGLGTIEVSYPGGSDLLIDYPTQILAGCVTGLACPLGVHIYDDGPGQYELRATYASVEHMGILRGVILGLDHIEELPR